MRRFFPLLIVCAVLFFASGSLAPLITAESLAFTLFHDGLERSYTLVIPDSYDGSAPVPLLIALHPSASSGRAMAALTGLDDAANGEGFIAVFPDSVGPIWGEDYTDDTLADDVGFISALIEQLAEEYTIDRGRVRVVGWSNGGLLAYRLACEVPDLFDAVAAVGPLLWEYHAVNCPAEAAAPVDLLVLWGDGDYFYTPETHEYASMFSDERLVILGVEDTMNFWTARNGCDPAIINAEAIVQTMAGCPDNGGVTLYRLPGGRRHWPRTGDYMLNPFAVDATAMITAFFAGDEHWAQAAPRLLAEENARTYTVYVPAGYDPAEPAPVMVSLHGRYGTGSGTAAYTGMNEIAEENNFIAVYPDGLRYPDATYAYDFGWNYFEGASFFIESDINDTFFLATLLDDLALDLNIDRSRIYVNGMSNGGFMALHLACVDAERYAGFASVAGSGHFGLQEICQTHIPVPIMIVHGTHDDNVLWQGRSEMIGGRSRYTSYPIPMVFEFFAQQNGCSLDAPETTDIPSTGASPDTQVRVIQATDCDPMGETVLYGVIGGGHNWPGNTNEDKGPDVNMDINTSAEIWEFMAPLAR
ncbi:alpha/beta hydrolase family esterase [Chloroflexota bacterium]